MKANFCKERLCPVCQWRKSIKDYSNLINMLSILEDKTESSYDYFLMEIDYLSCEAGYLIERVEKIIKNVKEIQKSEDIEEISDGFFRNLNIFYNKNKDVFDIKVYFLFVVQKNTLTNKEKFIEIYKKNSVLGQLEEIKIEKITEENKSSKIKQVTKETVDTNDIRTGKLELDLYNFNILIDVLHRKKFKEYSGSLLMAKTLISNFNNLCRIDFLKGE